MKNDNERAKGEIQKKSSGLLAQELIQVLPEAVEQNESGEYFVNYNGVVPLLLEALKEQKELIEDLQKRIETLEEK